MAVRQPPSTGVTDPIRTVSEILDAYHHHCAVYYRRPDGSTTSQLARVVYALGPVRDLYGDTPAGSFGPHALKALREHLIRGGLWRRYVNSLVRGIKRCFKWAAAEELASPSIYHGLLAVEGLKAGRTEARDSAPVRPVPQADVDAVEPHVLRPVWDLIRFQLLTGTRPGEALVVAPGLLDRSGIVWRYRVEGTRPPAADTIASSSSGRAASRSVTVHPIFGRGSGLAAFLGCPHGTSDVPGMSGA